MMNHAFNRFLPNDMGWRDLFEMVSTEYLCPLYAGYKGNTCQPLHVIVLENSLRPIDYLFI